MRQQATRGSDHLVKLIPDWADMIRAERTERYLEKLNSQKQYVQELFEDYWDTLVGGGCVELVGEFRPEVESELEKAGFKIKTHTPEGYKRTPRTTLWLP